MTEGSSVLRRAAGAAALCGGLTLAVMGLGTAVASAQPLPPPGPGGPGPIGGHFGPGPVGPGACAPLLPCGGPPAAGPLGLFAPGEGLLGLPLIPLL